jgi:N,N'-diacetylbacillosaminyl-diphospho-undecaprenol alpha-1,3-N-acetylgalactosaminyltransferase
MRIALVGPYAITFKLFLFGLIEALVSRGHSVTVYCSPDDEGGDFEFLESLGARCVPIPIYRFISPVRDLKLLFCLYRIFRKENYDIVSNFTIKPNIYGAMAARLAGCKRVVDMAMGLGVAFSSKGGVKQSFLRGIACVLYRLGFFLNPDDLREVLARKLIKEEKCVLVKGIGVDCSKYSPEAVDQSVLSALRTELGLEESTRVVLMMCRMFWTKGIREYAEAAKSLSSKFPDVKFLLVGPLEKDNLEAVGRDYLEQEFTGQLQWLGFRRDARELSGLADIIVLPSYYREGLPQVLLEGAALGKPLVTTDNVGCREAVDDGKNGFLIPIKDSAALADATARLLENAELRAEFGRQSRQKALAEFDKEIIVSQMLTQLYELQ